MADWKNCKNILVIRPDNMGDLLMSTPAIRALKETFDARITVLTSAMATPIAHLIPEISEVITYDLPWVKTPDPVSSETFNQVVKLIENKHFDAAVIFTVYSQNPLPAAMLAYLAKIPRRLAYCRENPYALLTDWIPDKEPYTHIKHQVQRDLDLVAEVGASTENENLSIIIDKNLESKVSEKLVKCGVNLSRPWIIVHAGVSESKREYPLNRWIETIKKLTHELNLQVLLTGTETESSLIEKIQANCGDSAFNLAGIFNISEFISLIDLSPLVISVNTGTIHIAAATQTSVIVLYAMTNPQHSPWKVKNIVLPFPIPANTRSRNEVIGYVHENLFDENIEMVPAEKIIEAAKMILDSSNQPHTSRLIAVKPAPQSLPVN